MNTQKFKTNIKCSGCLAKVTPFLNATAGEDNWEVDLQSPQKTLTIISEEQLTDSGVINAVQQAGFTAERLS